MDEEQAVDVRGLAAMLQVSTSTVYQLVASHEIPFFRVGSRLRFWPSEVREHLARQTAERDPWTRSPQGRAALYRGARKRLAAGRGSALDREIVRDYRR